MQNSHNKRRMCIVSAPVCVQPSTAKPEVTQQVKEKSCPKYIKLFLSYAKELENDLKDIASPVVPCFLGVAQSIEKKINKLILKWRSVTAYGYLRRYTVGRLKALFKPISVFVFAMPLFTGMLNLGFDLYIGDNYIGVVRGYEYTAELIDEANRELSETWGVTPVRENPKLFLRIVNSGGFSDGFYVRDNILVASGQMQRAAVLYAAGERLFAAYDQECLENILNTYKSAYQKEKMESCEIGVETEVRSEVVLKSEILGSSTASNLLKDQALPVITKEYTALSQDVEAPVEKTYDDTMRVGNVTVVREGEDGLKEIKLLVTRINGETVNEEVVEETILSTPVARIEMAGTREPLGVGSGTFLRPTSGEVTSSFGPRWGRMHNGVDFAGNEGDPIVATDGGEVVFCGIQSGYGSVIILNHKNGYKSKYAHCSKLLFKLGDRVDKGEKIALIGNTGNSTGPHLHFEILKDDIPKNPLNYIKR